MFNNLSKSVKSHHLLVLLGLVVLGVVLMHYSGRKSMLLSGMQNNEPSQAPVVNTPSVQASSPNQNSVYASVSGGSAHVSAPSCSQKSVADPADLLPNVNSSDSNGAWGNLNPTKDLKNVSLLDAGYHTGINTQGSSLRNANLQLRSEPANPQSKVSPWMNSTIDPDSMRRPLEIGGC